MKKKYILILGIIAAILVGLNYFLPSLSWSGAAWGELVITITAEETDKPIAGATVELRYPRKAEANTTMNSKFYDRLLFSTKSDINGVANIRTMFNAGGGSTLFFRTGRVLYKDIWIMIKAPRYTDKRVLLSTYTGVTRSIHKSQRTDITITLDTAK